MNEIKTMVNVYRSIYGTDALHHAIADMAAGLNVPFEVIVKLSAEDVSLKQSRLQTLEPK